MRNSVRTIRDYLVTHGRCLRRQDLDDGGDLMWYSLGRGVVILHIYNGEDGCDVYIQEAGNSVEATLEALKGMARTAAPADPPRAGRNLRHHDRDRHDYEPGEERRLPRCAKP